MKVGCHTAQISAALFKPNRITVLKNRIESQQHTFPIPISIYDLVISARERTSLLFQESDSDSLPRPISDDSDSIHDSLFDRNRIPYNRADFADIFKGVMLFLDNCNPS